MAGRRCVPPRSSTRLAAFDPNCHKTYAGDKREGAENGGDWQRVLSFVGDLDRPEIDVFFLVGVRDASGGKSDDGQENEQCSDDGCWFHLMGMTFRASTCALFVQMLMSLEIDVLILGLVPLKGQE
jgi:hypothetical protein